MNREAVERGKSNRRFDLPQPGPGAEAWKAEVRGDDSCWGHHFVS